MDTGKTNLFSKDEQITVHHLNLRNVNVTQDKVNSRKCSLYLMKNPIKISLIKLILSEQR